MKQYTFGNIRPQDIHRVYHNDDYTQIEIVTVIGHHLFISVTNKKEYDNCVKQLHDYCAKARIGVRVRGYDEED